MVIFGYPTASCAGRSFNTLVRTAVETHKQLPFERFVSAGTYGRLAVLMTSSIPSSAHFGARCRTTAIAHGESSSAKDIPTLRRSWTPPATAYPEESGLDTTCSTPVSVWPMSARP